jgi:hypothetical protein
MVGSIVSRRGIESGIDSEGGPVENHDARGQVVPNDDIDCVPDSDPDIEGSFRLAGESCASRAGCLTARTKGATS